MELSIQSGSKSHVHWQLDLAQTPVNRSSSNRLLTDRQAIMSVLTLITSSFKLLSICQSLLHYLPPPPLLSLFFLVGLFTFASGQCTGDQQHVQYKTTIACLQQLPIPADISIECASSDLILQDGTTMFLISRTFVPSCSDTRPILTDTLQIAPIPGNPTDKQSYQHHMPTFCILFVITQGTVASADTTGPSATLSFPLAMSNYIQSSVKSSTLAFVSFFISVFLLT